MNVAAPTNAQPRERVTTRTSIVIGGAYVPQPARPTSKTPRPSRLSVRRILPSFVLQAMRRAADWL